MPARRYPSRSANAANVITSTAERQKLMDTVTYAACHFQNDPHVMRNCTSSVEEFTYNQTPRRDDILRGFVKHQARYVKRADNHDAFNMYARFFDKSNGSYNPRFGLPETLSAGTGKLVLTDGQGDSLEQHEMCLRHKT